MYPFFKPPPTACHRNGWQQMPPPRVRPNYHTHILLFLMTVITTAVAGMLWENLNPMQNLGQFYRGLPYAGTLLTILFFHEMGHYLTARYYGMDVTLPYFIPMPPPLFMLGTLGAVIRIQQPWRHRRALLHVGAAGPIAGFCVALPAIIYAYATANVAPLPEVGSDYYWNFGEPLLLKGIGYLVVGPIPAGFSLQINSVGVAAWFGILVTMLNLLPVGQLDGGHIVYALLGRHARYVSWGGIGVLLAMGSTLLYMGESFGLAWFIWAIIGWLTSRRRHVILDQQSPLNLQSRTIAWTTCIIFVLCFMPTPISISSIGG
ncbi:hypothetical protein NKDENANG_02212 [Candidatus Entotheonellaceae bacterium PAL068K]